MRTSLDLSAGAPQLLIAAESATEADLLRQLTGCRCTAEQWQGTFWLPDGADVRALVGAQGLRLCFDPSDAMRLPAEPPAVPMAGG